MTNPYIARIAAGLTEAQRSALLAPHWSARRPLLGINFAYWGRGMHGKTLLKLRPVAFEVRRYLQEREG